MAYNRNSTIHISRDLGIIGVAGNGNIIVTNKFGQNPDLDGGAEDVWDGGGDYTWQSSAKSVEVVSTDAEDTDATGTGAWSVFISGLDGNWNYVSETVALAGLTPAPLTNQYLRIYRAYVATSGTSLSNAGALIIRVASGGDTMARILAGNGQTLMGIFSIRAGYTGYIRSAIYTVSADASTDVLSRYALLTNTNGQGWRIRDTAEVSSTGPAVVEWTGGVTVPEKTDIRVRSLTNTGVNRIGSAKFSIIEVKD